MKTRWQPDANGNCTLACPASQPNGNDCPWALAHAVSGGPDWGYALVGRPCEMLKVVIAAGMAADTQFNAWATISIEKAHQRDLPGEYPDPVLADIEKRRHEAQVAKKCCGACFFGTEMRCPCVTVDIHSELGGYRPRDDGPPWPDCRFWKPKDWPGEKPR